MRRKNDYLGFKIPIHLSCGNDNMRPVMRCVYFEGDYMYATNAHLAIKAKIDKFSTFSPDEIKLLDGKLIKSTSFKNIFNADTVKVSESGFFDVENDIEYKFTKMNIKFPDINKIFNERLTQVELPLGKIGLNSFFLNQLSRSMQGYRDSLNHLHLSFCGQTKAFLVEHPHYTKEELCGIIMPVNI